jgi:DNA-binding SARP family transcriptional activator
MLKVQLSGGVSVESDDQRLPDALLAGRQGRLVLAYLICERHRSVPREELAELLWPDRLPSAWTSSLSVVVSKLRRLFSEAGLDPAATLASSFGSYRLHLPDDVWIDVEAVAKAVESAEAAEREGRADEALTAATGGAEIAERGFLTDDCAWVDTQRERLRDLHVRAVGAQARAYLLAGQSARAVVAARDALGLDDLREASYRTLMQALAAAGERGEALRVWERCRVMLTDELGVDPAPETEAVYLSLLGETPVAAAPSSAGPANLPSGVVTFLLTDIVDSCANWEKHPAAMAVALERHDHLVADTIASYGGTVLKAKLEGDATVSVFPRASEAARAALALRAALMDEAWPEGAALRVRMALHTGEALERAGDYFGPALNRAARLRALADADQILVSQAVAEVVADHLPKDTLLRSLGERQLRGLSRSEHVFELGPLSGLDTGGPVNFERPPFPAMLVAPGVFVGRAYEFDQLAAEWGSAKAGMARAVLIAGEPGVGKSRLASEWARRAYEEGATVLYGRCDEELGAPYQPFAESLRALLPAFGARRLRSVRGVEHLARLTPELAEYLPNVRSASEADPDTDRALLFDGLVRLLADVAVGAPLVLVIDDLHWAAKPTLLMLRHLLRAGQGMRLLIIGTYRSTDLTRAHPLAASLADLHRDATAARLTLSGLDAAEVSTFLQASGHDDARLGQTLATATSGNPFFLIEVLRHVDETDGTWDATTLPQGVREAVDRRLSALSELANEALLVGAVAGGAFSLDLVESVLERDLVEPIDEARRAGLVVEETGDRFRFYHALVRQSLLAECVSVKRVRLHQRIAAVLEAAGATGDAHLTDLARHYFECAFAGGAAKAVDYSRRAGEQAMTRLAYEDAADLYGQALQAAEVEGSECGDEARAELLLARCDALLAAGDPATAGTLVDQLTAVARQSPRLSAWATCFAGQLAVLSHPEALQATVVDVEAAAGEFARLGDADGEAKAHTVAASCLARLGRVAECESALDRALVAARLAGNSQRVNAVLAFAPEAALWGPHPVSQASGRCLDVVRVLRITTGSSAVEAAALRCQALLEAVRGRPEAARRMLGSARRSLESLGHTHGLLETDLFAGMVEFSAGEPGSAETLLRQAYDGFLARGVSVDAAHAAALLARALVVQGRIDQAIALSQESQRLAGVDIRAAMAWRTARAEALANKGDHAEALELARHAVALGEPTDALLDRAGASMSLALVLRRAGDEAGSQREARQARELFERKGASALVAALEEAIGSASPGRGAAADINVAHRRFRPNAAYALFERGARLFETGKIDAWADLFADDYVEVDHISHLTSDRETFVDAARTFAAAYRMTNHQELLAALGERHALLRYTWRYEAGAIADPANVTGPLEFVQLGVVSVDTTGLARRSERFKVDELHLALARLIELHAENELPAAHRPVRHVLAEQCREERGRWSPDVVWIDHRWGDMEVQGPVAADDATALWHEMITEWRWRTTDLLALTERFWVVESVGEGYDPDGAAIQVPTVTVVDYGEDGLIHRTEVYRPDQIDQALARFDELVSEVAPIGPKQGSGRSRLVRANAATAQMERVAGLYMAGDIEALRGEYSGNFVHVDCVNRVTIDRDAHLREMAQYTEPTNLELGFEVLASLGERHALTRWDFQYSSGIASESVLRTGDVESAQLLVSSVDSAGRQSRLERFGAHQLPLALARLIELHADDELPPERREIRYGVAEVFRNPMDRWSEDFVAIDHRWVERGSVIEGPDVARYAFDSWRDVGADLLWRVVDVLAFNEDVAVLSFVGEGRHDGDAPIEMPFLLVIQVGVDGLLSRSEIYDADRIDEAFSRFDELTRAPFDRYPTNQATNFLNRVQQAIFAGDWHGLEEMTTDDTVLDDRRAIVRHLSEGREAVVREWRSTTEVGVNELSFVPFATRGRLLSLSRITARGQGGSSEFLGVHEITDGGKVKGNVLFDTDDLDVAFDELDARYLAGEGAPFADTLAPCFELGGAYNQQDWTRFRDLLCDDFRCTFNVPAPVGYGLDGPDQFTAAIRSTVELAPATRGRNLAIPSLQHGAVLIWSETTSSTSEGVDAAWPLLMLAICRDGKIARLEYFTLGQLDLAFSRLRDLTQPEPEKTIERASAPDNDRPFACRRRIRPNAATTAAVHGLWETDDVDRWAESFSPDFVDVDHTAHTTTGRDAILEMMRIAASERVNVEGELLATLGERHMLSRMTSRMQDAGIVDSDNRIGDLEIVLLVVTRVDTSGRIAQIERFKPNDLGLALARLVELHAEDELPPEQRERSSIVAGSLRAQTIDNSADAVVVDHRLAGDALLQEEPGTHHQGTDGVGLTSIPERRRIVDVLGFTKGVALFEIDCVGPVMQSGSQFRVIAINQTADGGQTSRSEVYSPSQLDKAIARFDELSDSSGTDAILPPNKAAIARRWETDALLRGDLVTYLACFAPDVVYEDRQYRLTVAGVAAIEGNARYVLNGGSLSELSTRLLATRGDRLSLHRTCAQQKFVDSGPVESEYLELIETDDVELICHFNRYLPNDLDAAFAELDARFAAGEGEPFDWAGETAPLAAYNRQDWAAYEASLAEDFRFVDHGTVRFGEQDRTQFMSTLRTGFDLVPDGKTRVLAVARLTTAGGVYLWERTGHDQTGGLVSWREVAIHVREGGLVQRMESFPIDQLATAVAQFDRLTAGPR